MPAGPTHPAGTRSSLTAADPVLERIAAGSFVLLAATLPWSIAPMGIAAGLCAALTVLTWVRRPARWSATPILAPAAGWAVALLLAALFAVDRSGSLPRLTKALFPLLALVSATHGRDPRTVRRAMVALLASAVLAALVGFAIFVFRGGGMLHRARGVVGHYMTFGGQLQLWLSLAAGLVALERSPRWRWGAALAAIPLLATLLATYTRSAWLGLAVALGTLFALARPRWVPALVAALALVLAFGPASLRTRALSVFNPHDATGVERTYMWRGGLAMFGDHPLTGVGLSDMKRIYERYKPAGATERAGHLHSVPVQIAASMGAVGLAAFTWLYGTLLWMAFAGLRAQARAGGFAAALRAGVAAALVGFLAAGLFEWNFGDEELLYPLFTLVGLAWAARSWPAERAGGAA
jgi:O-antigen ligase